MANDENRLHWFCFTYATSSAVSSTYTGYKDKRILLSRINENKDNANMPSDAVLITVTYLGEMTRKEFVADTPLEEET